MVSTAKPRVLLVTNMFPVPRDPTRGVFVARQTRAVSQLLSVPVEVVVVGRTGAGNILQSRDAVRERVRVFAPDLVHVYYGLSGAALPFRTRLPVLVTLCGSDLLRWHVAHDAWGFVEFATSTVTAHRARRIVVQSTVVRNALPFQALRSKTRVLATGIDLDQFCPLDRAVCRAGLNWPSETPVVLFGADPDRAVKQFWLARAACDRVVRDHNLPVRLECLSRVRPEDVPRYINAADCVVITSRWEAGPIVLSEALACGVPVVTVPVGYALDEQVGDSYLYVTAPEPRALAERLAAVIRQPPPHVRPVTRVFPTQAEYARSLLELYVETP